jgi:hypothetical protein
MLFGRYKEPRGRIVASIDVLRRDVVRRDGERLGGAERGFGSVT